MNATRREPDAAPRVDAKSTNATSHGRAIAPVPRLALTVEEACAALGVGQDFWREHVAPEVHIVRRGRRKLIAVAALQAWLDTNGHRIVDDLR